MERVLTALFQPLLPPRKCWAHRYLVAVRKDGLVKNPKVLTLVQGAIMIIVLLVVSGLLMEMTGKPAPLWITDNLKLIFAFLFGVALPTREGRDGTEDETPSERIAKR